MFIWIHILILDLCLYFGLLFNMMFENTTESNVFCHPLTLKKLVTFQQEIYFTIQINLFSYCDLLAIIPRIYFTVEFYPEDGGSIFFQNVHSHTTDYTTVP